jgi:hypothetical protein
MASDGSYDGTARTRRQAVLLCLGALTGGALTGGALAGCAVHWPWKSHAARGPATVQVIGVQVAGAPASAPAIAQYWDGPALLLDLRGQGGEGSATLSAPEGGRWPPRMEFRVQPGQIARLEVLAGERTQFEVPPQGAPVVLHLRLDGYRGDTPSITLQWRAADDSAR